MNDDDDDVEQPHSDEDEEDSDGDGDDGDLQFSKAQMEKMNDEEFLNALNLQEYDAEVEGAIHRIHGVGMGVEMGM